MRDVHEFDGKVPMKLDVFYEEEEVRKIFNSAGFLWKLIQPDALRMLDQLMYEPFEKNMDLVHQTDARQVLVALLEKILALKGDDQRFFSSLLEEQLCDMKRLGPCPQGRTVRLWQLFQSFG